MSLRQGSSTYGGWCRIFLFLAACGWVAGQLPVLVNPNDFPPVPKQLSVKVEVVLPDEKIVEEFMMYWDEELNLARYDYALGKIMAPYNTTRPMKTIQDFGNAISFNMDGILPNCTMFPLGYILTEAGVAAPLFRPRRLIGNVSGNLTLNQLLRALDPRQLFYLNETDRVHNTTAKETIRGIPCEVWTVFDNDFYIPGYGKARVRHRLYFMTKEFTRLLVGDIPHMIPVQRVTGFSDVRSALNSYPPRIIFNFFDFTVPPVPTIYDFSISQCIPKTKLDSRESIQMRFPGNFTGMRSDQFIPQFRRSALKRFLAVGEISPVRMVGMFPSQDSANMYITATVLPRPPAQLLFTQVQAGVRTNLPDYVGLNSVDLPAEQFNICAKMCVVSPLSPACLKVAWCRKEEVVSAGTGGLPTGTTRRCVVRYGQETSSRIGMPRLSSSGTLVNYTCDIYQKIINNSVFDGPVIESLFKIMLDVQENNFTVSATANGSTVTLQAEDMRTDVSLNYEDTPTPSVSDARSSFDFYRGQTTISGAAVKDQFSKLSPAECRRRCLDEKSFTCHSIASCVHGDCFLSDKHGDELANMTDGKANLQSHTHCVVWTRSWKGMFTLASLLVPESPPDLTIYGASNEDTCAKQCLFGNLSCESFSYCPTTPNQGAKGKHDCQLYNHHAFDIMHEERVHKPGCWHFSRNYVQDFDSSPGYELNLVGQDEFITKAEIEPALERWHCAKECIDKLGDDGCLAFDICEDRPITIDEDDVSLDSVLAGPQSIKCRISSSYVGVLSNNTKKVKTNENCTLYTRTTYLDGTLVNPKTVAAQNRNDSLTNLPLQQRSGAGSKEFNGGYTISDMAGIAIGMLIFGVVVTAVVFVLRYRPINSAGVAFQREIPFVRFT